MEQLYEKEEVDSLFFGVQGVFSLYGVGLIEGLVLEIGDGVTQIVPVYNGNRLDFVTERQNLAGKDITNLFRKRLFE